MCVVNRYQSGWIVTLLNPPDDISVYSLQTLEQTPYFSISIVSSMPTQTMLIFSNYTSIMSRVNRSTEATAASAMPKGVVPNMSVAIAPLLAGSTTHAVIALSIVNANFAAAHCELNTTLEDMPVYFFALIYSSSASPQIVEALSLAAATMNPVAASLYKQYFVSNCTYSQAARPLTIFDFVGLFSILCVSVFCALFAMIVNVVWHEFKMLYNRRRLRVGIHYRFGKSYCARVVKVGK